MKKLFLVFFIILSFLLFPQMKLEVSRTIPMKYAPTSITVDEKGNIYSASSFTGVIVKYDENFKYQHTLKFFEEKAITDIFYYKNNLYILFGKGIILKLDNNDKIVKEFNFKKGNLLGELDTPNGLYVDEEGIYICDTKNSRIVSMDFEGKNIKSFGYKTFYDGGFIEPFGISKLNGKYVIVDNSTKEVNFFDKDGFYVSNLKNQESKEKFLVSPEDIYVDLNGDIYIIDSGSSQILLFTPEGVIKSIGEKGGRENKFYSPRDIWVSKDKIYVADTMNKSVKILDKKTYEIIEVLGLRKRNTIIGSLIVIGLFLVVFFLKKIAKKKGDRFE